MWVRHRAVAYFTGQGFLFGADAELFPRKAYAPGKYAVYVDPQPQPIVAVCADDLRTLANGEWDYAVVGPRVQTANRALADILRETARKLKTGGHLVLYQLMSVVPPAEARALLAQVGSWMLKDTYEQAGVMLQIYKKLAHSKGVVDRKPSTKPRACIARYGALGDMIMVTPLIRKLAEDGYEVTLNISPYSALVLKNNPYIHNLIIQERDAIPNHTLGAYWDEWKKDYDKYINLSESIEGALLKVEGRREFFTHQQWRHEHCNKNYYDRTMQLGGYPEAVGTRGELYFTNAEDREARWFRNKHKDKFLVLWALNGSSHHKRYGLLQPVLTDWLQSHPNVVVVTLGDEKAKEWEFEHPQVLKMAGEWSLRMSMCMTQYADLVVGPESMLVNAAACYDTPKLTMLSHSSHDNLCKYWTNDYCLAPDPTLAPCYPCHQLHYSLPSCPISSIMDNDSGKEVTSGPTCAMGAITGERLIARLDEVYNLGSLRPLESRNNS